MKTTDNFLLLHLADSAWPTGSFAFSNGLEALAKMGRIRDFSALMEALRSALISTSEADLPFLNSAFALADDCGEEEFEAIVADWVAFNTVESMRRANEILGDNWWQLVKRIYNPPGLKRYEEFFQATGQAKYFTVAFPLLLKSLDFSLESIHQLFYHMAIRDQLSAAIRLGLIGPTKAQEIHAELSTEIIELSSLYSNRTHPQAVRSQLTLELAQASHQYLHSRLFQN
jgi:urease accessory protein